MSRSIAEKLISDEFIYMREEKTGIKYKSMCIRKKNNSDDKVVNNYYIANNYDLQHSSYSHHNPRTPSYSFNLENIQPT